MNYKIASSVILAAVVAGSALFLYSFAARADTSESKESKDVSSTQPAGPLSFVVKDIKGADYDLSQHKGKVGQVPDRIGAVFARRLAEVRRQVGLSQGQRSSYGRGQR